MSIGIFLQVLSTVESGRDYISKLQDLLKSVDLAEEQVRIYFTS